jgi:hypothetical protein
MTQMTQMRTKAFEDCFSNLRHLRNLWMFRSSAPSAIFAVNIPPLPLFDPGLVYTVMSNPARG